MAQNTSKIQCCPVLSLPLAWQFLRKGAIIQGQSRTRNMKLRNVNLRVFGMMDLMTAVFGNKADVVVEDSKVYTSYTFGDCEYSLISIEDFINCFSGEESNDLWNEVKVSLRITGDDEILPEDVADVYVDLVG